MSDTTSTPTIPNRGELVARWRDVIQQLEITAGEEREALIQELGRIESMAMRLILQEAGQ